MPIDPEMILARRMQTESACRDSDPQIFEAINWIDATPALALCRSCPLNGQPCMEWIKPKQSYFDGVAAEQVWKDGKRVTRPRNILPMSRSRLGCGTHLGVTRHRQRQEGLCPLCIRALESH